MIPLPIQLSVGGEVVNPGALLSAIRWSTFKIFPRWGYDDLENQL